MLDAPNKSDAGEIRLGAFIREGMTQIVAEWSSFASTRAPASKKMTADALKDHIEMMLVFIADDLETFQTNAEQLTKSKGNSPPKRDGQHSAAEVHAALRLGDGFDMDQMVSEYRALRASVTKLWIARKRDLDSADLNDLIRFNEAIDQSVAESVGRYTALLDRSRNLFLGILGHDLRNPVGAASMCAEYLIRSGKLDTKQGRMVIQIKNATSRANSIIEDLLDLTRIQFGSDIQISRSRMNVAQLSEQLIEEMRALYPNRVLQLTTTGDMEVEWDRSRIGQVISNLVGNAMEHGFKNSPTSVAVAGKAALVELSVRNMGKPIPPDSIESVFELFKQGAGESEPDERSMHLGLGLHITKEIVLAHGGTIAVTSTEKDGTTFTATIPRTAGATGR
jgi:signal transduction histidine kinase